MPRTQAVFDTIFALDSPSPPYILEYATASDEGLDEVGLQQRREREAKSLASWQARFFSSLAHLHTWLYEEHGCYAVKLAGSAADPAVAKHMYGK